MNGINLFSKIHHIFILFFYAIFLIILLLFLLFFRTLQKLSLFIFQQISNSSHIFLQFSLVFHRLSRPQHQNSLERGSNSLQNVNLQSIRCIIISNTPYNLLPYKVFFLLHLYATSKKCSLFLHYAFYKINFIIIVKKL